MYINICLNCIRNLSETIDPNAIKIDPSNLLETEMDYIYHEFKKLLDDLQKKIKDGPKVDLKAINGKSVKKSIYSLKDK